MSDRTNTRIARKQAQRQLRVKRTLITLSLMVLVAVVSIGGTIAWLQDGTETITNTFAPTGIEITLTETFDGTETDDGAEFDIVPSKAYQKDPVVTVVGSKTDVDVYLFVKFEETGEPGKYFEYSFNDTGWEKVPGVNPDNVWYRAVPASTADQSWHLLNELADASGKHIRVKSGVKETDMTAASAAELKFTAYAIQTAGFEGNVANAWAAIGN